MRKPNNGSIPAGTVVEAYKKDFRTESRPWWLWLFFWVTPMQPCFHMADADYQEIDYDYLAAVIALDQSEREQYIAETFDCDDYAYSLMGAVHHDRYTAAMPIFVTWVTTPMGGHAVLSFYDKDEILIIEPQNDTIFSVPLDWGLIQING